MSFPGWKIIFDGNLSQQEPFPIIPLSEVSTASSTKTVYSVILKRHFELRLVVISLLVSWESSNGVGEGKKELSFHSCVHATSSKTAKLLQLG